MPNARLFAYFPCTGPSLVLQSVRMDRTPLLLAHLLLFILGTWICCVFGIFLWRIILGIFYDNSEQNPEITYTLVNSDEDNIIETAV